MAFILRTAMDCKVLQACMKLIVVSLRSLKSVHHGTAHDSGQIWIFTICLLAASPSRVSEYIDIRCPYGQTVVSCYSVTGTCDVILDALLCGSHVEHFLEKGIVPAGCHAYGLRKYRSKSIAGRAMKSFIPPVILFDSKFRDCRAFIVDQGHLLLESESADKVFRSGLRIKRRVLIRMLISARNS